MTVLRRVSVAFALALASASALAAPQPARKAYVQVFGDRYGTAVADGLLASDPAIGVGYATSDGADLLGGGYQAFLASLRDHLGRAPKPDAAVIMIGERDEGPLADGGTKVEVASPAWAAAYAARVDAVSKLFAEAHVPLIWVGLPPVRDEARSAAASRIDGLLRDRAAADGTTYVDIWSGFTDEAGRYAPEGPDEQGNQTRLRRGDGFTPPGARKLASYVRPVLARMLGSGSRAAGELSSLTIERARDFDAALSIDVNAQIRREAARTGAGAGAAAPPAASASLPPAPAAGPVLPLTPAAVPTAGELASPTTALASLPLVADDGAPPHPGRADDFTWPRP